MLIDGRTVYTPLFSGVFWDLQDVMLEDVERIEVISGPGATLWGANAVNGVIEYVDHAARRTLPGACCVGRRRHRAGAAFRYGGSLGATRRIASTARRFTPDTRRARWHNSARRPAHTSGGLPRRLGRRAERPDASRGTRTGSGPRSPESVAGFVLGRAELWA